RWQAGFLSWAQSQLEAGRSVAPLKLSDDPADTQWNRDLLLALDALARLQAPTLERKFSAQLFGDSKRFEDLRGAVSKVLHLHDPESGVYGEDGWALLRAHRLDRAPEYTFIAGAVALRIGGVAIDLAPLALSVGLPSQTLRDAEIAGCAATAVVTIENLTSFTEFVSAKPSSILSIFTCGFASPAVISFLQGVRAARRDL